MHENKYPLKRIAQCEKEEGVGWNYQIVDHDPALIALSRTSPLLDLARGISQISFDLSLVYFTDHDASISLICNMYFSDSITYISYLKRGWNYQIVAHDWALIALSRTSPL